MSGEPVVGSFLEPRLPLVNAWNRHILKPTRAMEVRKNLVYHMGESDEDDTEDTIKVFLRLKPCEDNSANILEILGLRTLLAKVPQSIINKKKICKHDNCKYTFSRIFGPKVDQKEIFSKCVESSVQDFINGKSCLLFSYGTTNAGKTFTVQGNADYPGIIPRTIAMIFKSVYDKQNRDSQYCPLTISSVVELNKKRLDALTDLKNKIMSWSPDKCQNESGYSVRSKNTCSSVDFVGDSTYREMISKLDAEITGKHISDESATFSVWVSFAEIYNEGIYDLLQPAEKGKRPQLKLAQDTFKNNFIKDLKHINVTSAAEAYQVLKYGRNNLCFATTGMNASSSRSHCIFSIKLTRFTDILDPECMHISSFSICDLAGAERQKNALNVGDRLKESQSINCSLHVLSRCFNIIRENQTRVEKQRIPFRDSKLTQLFQNALSGKENITMIINVNPSVELYEETQHVLKASAIARNIVFEPKRNTKSQQRQSRFSSMLSKHKRETSIPWDSSVKPNDKVVESSKVLNDINEDGDATTGQKDEMEYLLSFIEGLQGKLKEERIKCKELKQKNLTLETDLRKELTSQFAEIMKFTKERNDENLQMAEKSLLDIERQRIALMKQRYEKELRNLKQKLNFFNSSAELSMIHNGDPQENEDLKDQIKDLEKQVEGLTELVNITKEENTQLLQKYSCLSMQQSVIKIENETLKKTLEAVKTEGNDLLLKELEMLRVEMAEKIKVRDEYLEDAREDLEYERTEKNTLEEQFSKLEKELAVKDQKVEDLESEINGLNSLLHLKNDTIDQLEAKIQTLAEEFDVLKSENSQLLNIKCQNCNIVKTEYEEKLDHLNTIYQQQEEDLKFSLNKILVQKDCEINNLKTKIQEEDLKCNLNEILIQKDSEIDNLKTTIQNYNIFMEAFEKKFIKIKKVATETCENLNALKSSFEKEIKTLKTRCHQQEEDLKFNLNEILIQKDSEIDNLKTKMQVATETCENLNALKSSFEEEIKTLKTRCHQQEETLGKIELDQNVLNDQLLMKNESIKKLEDKIQVMSEEYNTLQEENISILNKKCENCENERITHEKQLSQRNEEIQLLEKGIKEMLQKNSTLEKEVKEKSYEINLLQKEMKKSMHTVEKEKQLAIKNTANEQEIEHLRSKLIAYENTATVMKSYSEEVDKKNAELAKLRQLTQNQSIVNQTLEQELQTFQSNQKMINARYEDQLRKCKEEIEREKREATSLSNTLYKSTPTPKKDLQAEIDRLKQELEAEKLSKSCLLEEVTILKARESTKENEYPRKNLISKVERPFKSVTYYVEDSSDNEVFLPKSERKVRPKSEKKTRSTNLTTVQPIISSRKTRGQRLKEIHLPEVVLTQDNADVTVQTKGRLRRRLYDPSQDNIDTLDSFEMGLYTRQESPGSAVKHTLRSRNRIPKPE